VSVALVWTVVLPLKGGSAAKSRLGAPPAVALALALDCLDAVRATHAVRSVLVVTSDGGTAAACSAAGAEVVLERSPGAGLLAAVDDGLAVAPRGPVVVLLGDLPALTPADLAAALDACGRSLRAGARSALVPDAEGTGSVLLAALAAGDLDPAFGPGSAAEHERRGAVRLGLDLPRLRRDVDTAADLAAALALGVGRRTRAALAGEAVA
jgi:2-phospho-L-lactate guanylyltransferase